ncbi:hypothetical protein FKP32DRAFT_135906 [Trametes sanguinea]|nr:hypothetical protein FKP32DRAFT_135906 [Trametes sanguinea]
MELVCSGSNTTWVRGYGLCKILATREGDNGVHTFDIERFTMAEIAARPLLLQHGRYFTFEDGIPVKTVEATECEGHAKYGLDPFQHARECLCIPSLLKAEALFIPRMGVSLVLTRCTEAKEWDLASAYSWRGSPPKHYYSNPPLKFWWPDMGVAIAGGEELVLNPTYDGILGLGISRYGRSDIDVASL